MSQTIAQSVAVALAAHGISPQAGHHLVAPPQPSHGHGSGLRMNLAFTYSIDSTQTSLMVLEYQQQQQFSPRDDDAYHPAFDLDYQGPWFFYFSATHIICTLCMVGFISVSTLNC
ncbi:hypothetical protein SLE2022_204740 [Rubroshorea leprosula]